MVALLRAVKLHAAFGSVRLCAMGQMRVKWIPDLAVQANERPADFLKVCRALLLLLQPAEGCIEGPAIVFMNPCPIHGLSKRSSGTSGKLVLLLLRQI